ncbi:MAG: diguanylate cyclase [Lysobacterales bacterium]
MTDNHETTQQYFNLTDAEPDGSGASLVVIRGEPFGKSFELGLSAVTIGRSNDCDLQFGEDSVSRRQCRVAFNGKQYRVKDLGSTNPTQVNGDVISECSLKDGDRLSFGGVVLKFVASDPVETAFHNELYARASSDPLTGIANRRVFEQSLEQAIRSHSVSAEPLSLAMVDLDRFKEVNDQYDHLIGDQVLKKVSDILNHQRADRDLIARLGGEEFSVMLPGLGLDEAAVKLEALRHAVARAPMQIEEQSIAITISVGVAQFVAPMRDPKDLLRAADQALFEAKAAGRNCVRMA